MSNLQNPQVIAVALGATIGVISAASLFIYQKVMEHKERTTMMNNLESVNRRVNELQIELENLRSQQNQLRARKGKNINRKRMASANSFYSTAEAENEIDAISVTETDIDDEFYDCSDDELTSGDLEMNGTAAAMIELTRELDVVDRKIENDALFEEALCDLRALAIWHENNVEVAWRLARACYKNASLLDDIDQQEALIQEGMEMCERILEKEHVDLHKWYALLVGLRTEYLPLKEKLEAGKRFEKHVRLALELKPYDSMLNHLLGRFQYSVSGLRWIEKKVCVTLFGSAPSSSYEEAIESLEKSEKYATQPDIENRFFLGQAYLKIKSYEKAIDSFKGTIDLKPTNKKQEDMQTEAADLISKYSSYC